LGESGWSGALSHLPDLEMYLPVPQHRKAWKGASDLVVVAFIETDEEIRARGGYTGYTTTGESVFIPLGKVPTRPVLAVYPVETRFDFSGEEPPVLTSNLAAAPPVGPNIIFPPDQPIYYCNSRNTLDTTVQICDIVINNIGQYEEFLRGSPELSILTRAVTVNASNVPVSWVNIGCNNEDQPSPSFLNSDSDHWSGRATIASRAAFQNQQAAGKRIFIMLWEDDNGSKCDFEPEGTTNPTNVSWATMMRLAVIPTLSGIADGLDGNPVGWLVAVGFGALSGIFQMFANSGDDLIGSVALPAGTNPFSEPKTVRINETTGRGSMKFVLD
jgi:hypothetical protein